METDSPPCPSNVPPRPIPVPIEPTQLVPTAEGRIKDIPIPPISPRNQSISKQLEKEPTPAPDW